MPIVLAEHVVEADQYIDCTRLIGHGQVPSQRGRGLHLNGYKQPRTHLLKAITAFFSFNADVHKSIKLMRIDLNTTVVSRGVTAELPPDGFSQGIRAPCFCGGDKPMQRCSEGFSSAGWQVERVLVRFHRGQAQRLSEEVVMERLYGDPPPFPLRSRELLGDGFDMGLQLSV